MSKPKIPIINRRGEVVTLDDDTDIIPPGHGVRVSSFLMDDGDGVQQAIAAERARVTDATMVTDAFGRKAGSRPGYCYGPTNNNEAQARAAYDARSKFMQDAWRTPSAKAAVTDMRPVTADDIEREREAWKQRLSNAWRTTGGVGFTGSFGGD